VQKTFCTPFKDFCVDVNRHYGQNKEDSEGDTDALASAHLKSDTGK
jgi:hypothetical protein